MPNADSLATIAQMHLVKIVDDGRAATDPFKIIGFLRAQHDADLDALETSDADTALTESDRAGGSLAARGALDKLGDFAREGFKFIDAIRAKAITDAQRLEVFTAYGWASGNLGRFGDARVIGLSRLAVLAHAEIDAAFRYPADLVADITAQLKVFDDNVGPATGGSRETATKTRNDMLGAAQKSLAQVRLYYCAASRNIDATPELSKINFQPRRPSGTVGSKPAPPPPPAGAKPA